MEMNRLTRDGTAEPVSRNQILRREQIRVTTSRIDNFTRLMVTLAICDYHTYIHTLIV